MIVGAQNYEDLRTVDGVLYTTFLEAAKAMQLLEDDTQWDKAMDEATSFRMPKELRQLFAVLLVHARPTDPKKLYESYAEAMREDYIGNKNCARHSEYMAEQLTLHDIQEHLKQFGKSLFDYNLPDPVDAYDIPNEVNIEKERQEADALVSMMNTEQHSAFTTIMNTVQGKNRQKCFFLSGAGGCGKTFVYKALTATIISQGGFVKAVAPTGLAATLLKGGKTVHSGFGLGIDLDKNSVSRIKQGTQEWRELLQTKLIIWDEISMCHVHLLLAVDRSLRDLLDCTEPFGGIPIVVGGDFRQQAPVVVHGNRVNIVEACVKSSHIWKKFQQLKLLQNICLIL